MPVEYVSDGRQRAKVGCRAIRLRGLDVMHAGGGAPWLLVTPLPCYMPAFLRRNGWAMDHVAAPAVVDDFGTLVPVGPWQ